MAYDYKPGEEEDVLKRYIIVAGVVLLVVALFVFTLYIGLGLDRETLKLMMKRFVPDPVNVAFVFAFVMASIALWGMLREPAAADDVQRRQTYFILLLLLAGILLAGTFYFKHFTRPTHEITKEEVCPRCNGTGRARLRPEYPCGYCDGTGYVSP